MTDLHRVQTFGVPDFEKDVLRRIFSLSRNRAHAYVLHDDEPDAPVQLFLVDMDNPGAVADWRAASGARATSTVMIADVQPEGCRHYVRRPFMATRLLGVLDRLAGASDHEMTAADRSALGSADSGAATRPKPGRPARSAPPPDPARSSEPDRAYRALVVDDSAPVRAQIGKVLTHVDVKADFADSGELALEKLDANRYDIVLLDVVMPGTDGYDVCKAIKRDRSRRHIPVIMLTGRSSPFDKVKGRLSGCDAYLTKPVKGRDFVTTLRKHLGDAIVAD